MPPKAAKATNQAASRQMTTQGTDISTILNTLRATATDVYQSAVPYATASNIVDVGTAVMSYPTIYNEFMTNLVNKIGLTLVDGPVFDNPLKFLKKGKLEYGQTIEDIYTGLVNAEPYVTGMNDDDVAAGNYPDPFKVTKMPHKASFYHTILSRQYTVTRHISDLRKAFFSSGSMEAFIAGIANSIRTGFEYDEYRMTVALMARQMEATADVAGWGGNVKLLTGFKAATGNTDITAENAFRNVTFLRYLTKEIQRWTLRLKNFRTDLNIAGVYNSVPKSRQRLMMLEEVDVDLNTELLAYAFNQENLGLSDVQVDWIDAWYTIGNDGSGAVPTGETVQPKMLYKTDGTTKALGVLYDPDMLKIYNKEMIQSSATNAAGNYINTFLSLEDIYAASPFKPFVKFLME